MRSKKLKETPKTINLSERQIDDLSLLYVVVQLFEYVVRINFELLNDLSKIKLKSMLGIAMWFNREAERKHNELQNELLVDDATELYKLCRALRQATVNGRENEFIEHMKNFK